MSNVVVSMFEFLSHQLRETLVRRVTFQKTVQNRTSLLVSTRNRSCRSLSTERRRLDTSLLIKRPRRTLLEQARQGLTDAREA